MRWTVHSEKALYEDEWLDIRVADVELPDGRHLEHRLIRTPPGAGCVVVLDGQALLLWRHRFITGSQGWEIPIGKIEPGEDPAAAAAREPRKRPGGGRDRSVPCSAWSRAQGYLTRRTLSTAPTGPSGSARRRTTSSPTACHGFRSQACPRWSAAGTSRQARRSPRSCT